MTIKNVMQNAMNRLIAKTGRQIMIRYFNEVIGSVWDDELVLTKSGNDLWTSGIILPVDSREGSAESVLLEQGKLIDNDIKLYTHGSLTFTGSDLQVKVVLGSEANQAGNSDVYSTIPLGGLNLEIQGTKIYKRQYLRRLTTGSLIGEV